VTTPAEARDGALVEIDRIVAEGGDADDVLRNVLAVLGSLYSYASVGFVEEGEIVAGPAFGAAGSAVVERLPISYQGVVVGELATTSPEADVSFLEGVAARISAHVLLGWDTGGETWEP
jgi:hypothetical protein